MDWGEYRLAKRKAYAFVGVLGHSRWLFFEHVESMLSEVLIACHQRMLGDFGGITREILYASMKTVVTQRDAYGRRPHRFQDAIQAFAGDCGYRPRLSRPARPQTKGKVERGIDYIANSFLHPFVTRLPIGGSHTQPGGVGCRGQTLVGCCCQRADSRHDRGAAKGQAAC